MSINEIRSAVCKKAYKSMRDYGFDKSAAFKYAWGCVKARVEEIKKEQSMIRATDLKEGDTVRMEFGDDGHFVTCTIISKVVHPKFNKYFLINAKYSDGRVFEFCSLIDDTFEIVAA